MSSEREAYIGLNMMEGIGPVKVRALVGALGSAGAILDEDRRCLAQVDGIGYKLADSLVRQREQLDPEAEEARARRMGAKLITWVDDAYPEALKTIHDPPLALYVKGTFEPRDRHAVAVVGSRRTTHYGRSVADRLSYQLAKVGFTVVSGLARGVDTAAHQGALKGGGRTIAVLGSGLDVLYPPENRALADAAAASGCVLSEFPLGTEPGKTTFPIRNRVVSGLSMGIVVVEAGMNSGALITADQALEQGRSVFAVPGRVDSPSSRGCHALIRQGARLVEGVDDLLEEFELLIPAERREAAHRLDRRPEVRLSDEEQRVVKALWDGPLNTDALARVTGLPSGQLAGLLIGLEMKRVAQMLPGGLAELAPGLRGGS
jgi:DNA processing protein